MPLPVTRSLVIPDAELEERFTPSGGPGGQHANRSNTRVELVWDIASSDAVSGNQRQRLIAAFGDTIRVVADNERSQSRNRSLARSRLAEQVSEALTPVRSRRATKPTRGSTRRRLEEKRRRGQNKALRRRPSGDD